MRVPPSARTSLDSRHASLDTTGCPDAEHGLPKASGRQSDTWVRAAVSPQLLSARRALQRETVKDKLRRFLSSKGMEEAMRRKKETETQRQDVKVLVRKFASRETGVAEASRRGERGRAWREARTPARANVLRLRRFWETVGA